MIKPDASVPSTGGQQWPPVFFSADDSSRSRALLLRSCCAALVAAAFIALSTPVLLAAPAAPGSGAYRLAGIIDSGANNRIGLLQLPRGAQVMIKQGSTIEGGGRVIEFSSRAVRIAFPDGHVVQIDLEGAGNRALVDNEQAGSHPIEVNPIVTKTDDHGNTLVRHIELKRFADAVQKQGQQGVAAGDITQRLQSLLKLPADSRIVAINDTPVGAAPQAIRKIQTLLARNVMASLNLESPSGAQRVYLMPDDPRRP